MAKNNITVNRSFRQGADLVSVVESFRNATDKLKQLKEIMDNMTDASDWTVIEAQFGVPVGKGEVIYNLVSGTVSELAADTTFNNLTDWVTPTT